MTLKLWRPLDAENIRDPYPMYRALREEEPVHRAQTGEYIISRYDDVKAILKSNSFQTGNKLDWIKREVQYFQNKNEDLTAIHEAMNSFVLMLNAPNHMRIRSFVAKCWDNREVDNVIQKMANDLVEN